MYRPLWSGKDWCSFILPSLTISSPSFNTVFLIPSFLKLKAPVHLANRQSELLKKNVQFQMFFSVLKKSSDFGNCMRKLYKTVQLVFCVLSLGLQQCQNKKILLFSFFSPQNSFHTAMTLHPPTVKLVYWQWSLPLQLPSAHTLECLGKLGQLQGPAVVSLLVLCNLTCSIDSYQWHAMYIYLCLCL